MNPDAALVVGEHDGEIVHRVERGRVDFMHSACDGIAQAAGNGRPVRENGLQEDCDFRRSRRDHAATAGDGSIGADRYIVRRRGAERRFGGTRAPIVNQVLRDRHRLVGGDGDACTLQLGYRDGGHRYAALPNVRHSTQRAILTFCFRKTVRRFLPRSAARRPYAQDNRVLLSRNV